MAVDPKVAAALAGAQSAVDQLAAAIKASTYTAPVVVSPPPVSPPPPPVSPPPPPVTPPVTPPTGTVTHGDQITTANTGIAGHGLTTANLTVHAGAVSVSDFGTNPTISKQWFKGAVTIDGPATFVDCQFETEVNNRPGNAPQVTFDYCTIHSDNNAFGWGLGANNYTATRCNISGGVDGVWINGNNTLVECFIRLAGQSSSDHNDGAQAYGSIGNVEFDRCNIDGRPLNNVGNTNSAIFTADSSRGAYRIYDCLLAGGAYTLRLQSGDSADVQGNKFVDDSWAYGPTFTYYAGNKSGDFGIDPATISWGNVRPNTLQTAGTVVPKP
jgi:hypothetical protein